MWMRCGAFTPQRSAVGYRPRPPVLLEVSDLSRAANVVAQNVGGIDQGVEYFGPVISKGVPDGQHIHPSPDRRQDLYRGRGHRDHADGEHHGATRATTAQLVRAAR